MSFLTIRNPHHSTLTMNSSGGTIGLDISRSTVSSNWPARASSPSVSCHARNPSAPAACQYGKMTKRPWRVKGDDKRVTKTATRPGQIVSVDQLESNTPGLIAQLKGKLTQQRYKYATVFVDQFSGYTFVYMQKRLTSEETVMAKHAFERSADQRGVKIIHYHADNGRFEDNAFIADCKAQRQGLTYCGVNAHFQNGIAERRIRDLQE